MMWHVIFSYLPYLRNYNEIVFTIGDHQTITFIEVVVEVMRHLEGAYAVIFIKSKRYLNELIACKHGSPLLLGVKVSYFLFIIMR